MFVAAAAFGVVATVSMVAVVTSSSRIAGSLEAGTEQLIAEQRIADEIVSASYAQQSTAYRYLEQPNPATRTAFYDLGQQAYEGVRQYLFREMPVESRMSVERIKEAHQDFEVAAQHAFDLALSGETGAARARVGTLAGYARALEVAVREFIADRERQRAGLRDAQQAALARLRFATAAVALALAVAALLLADMLRRRVVLPLDELATSVRRLGAGEREVRAAPQRYVEFQLLADSFDEMANRIRTSHAEVEARNAQLTRALDELKRAQQDVLQHEKLSAMGEMLAGLAHELNNPLAGILGLAECINAELAAAPDAAWRQLGESIAEPLITESLRARDLVRNLLHFSRRAGAQLSAVSLAPAVSVAVILRRHAFTQNDKAIEVDIPDALYVVAEEQRLQLVVVNILNNALDAMRGTHGRLVRITAVADDAAVILSFTDEGPGFSNVDRIFDPFYTTKAVGEGTGLGLSLVHRFVHEFGGSIAASPAPHGGAVITIRLARAPVPEPDAAPVVLHAAGASPAIARAAEPRRGRKKILIVDDEPSIREAQRRILSRLDADVVLAADGLAAREALATDDFDLVITDLRMPGVVSGYELFEWMRTARPVLAARALVVTGDIGSDEGAPPAPVPDDRVLAKPFSLMEYLERVRRALAEID